MTYDQGRYELKYVVHESARARLVELANQHSEPDPHGVVLAPDARGYVVHSLYFDTPTLDDYTARLCRRPIRRRMRIRTYGAPGDRAPVFYEGKRKMEVLVIKHRALVTDGDAWRGYEPGPGDPSPWRHFAERMVGKGRTNAVRFADVVEHDGLVPVTLVRYTREVWVDPRPGYHEVRLTIDRRIQAGVWPTHDLYGPTPIDLVPNEWMVLELKFAGAEPGWMREIVRELRLVGEQVSKYGLSVALGHRADHPREATALTPPTILRARRAEAAARSASGAAA